MTDKITKALHAAIFFVERYGDSRKDQHYIEQFKEALQSLDQKQGDVNDINAVEMDKAAKNYLKDLQHTRLPHRKSFDEPPELMRPEIKEAWEMTQEILTRCCLSPVEVDHIKAVHAFIQAAQRTEVKEVTVEELSQDIHTWRFDPSQGGAFGDYLYKKYPHGLKITKEK